MFYVITLKNVEMFNNIEHLFHPVTIFFKDKQGRFPPTTTI